MESLTVGLDIGSSAVRAAEIHVAKDGRRTLRHYGQVGLPPGYVVDGEINNIPGVAAAIKRLWAEGGFSTREVILGVSGPRVFVRQADVPALAAEDLRSSLRFDAQEMIPIPMEEASFDFSLLPKEEDSEPDTKRILLVAAHRDLLRTYMATLKEAGLSASVMDAAPLALLRAVPQPEEAGSSGISVVVSIGAELTTVAVTEAGVPRFLRSLTIGGSTLTERIANSMHIEMAVAERLKRGASPGGGPQMAQARKAMTGQMSELADEVRATIDFFVSQSGSTDIERLIITGGASQTQGLAARVAGHQAASAVTFDPLAALDASGLPFEGVDRARISATSATAIGLALWYCDGPLIRLNVLPEEVAAARRTRRLATAAATGVAAVVGVLGVVGVGQVIAVHRANDKVHAAEAEAGRLNAQVSHLEAITAVHTQVQARARLVSAALQGDVDWVRVMGQLGSVMPAQLSLTSLSAAKVIPSGSSAAASSTSVGSLNFSVKGTGGLPAVAAWIQGLQSDPDVTQVWVTGVQVKANGGDVTFASTALLTPLSESNRAKEVQG